MDDRNDRLKTIAVASLALLLASGCGDDPKKRLGAVCESDGECASGLCLEQTCLDPERDDDGDSLLNRFEGGIATSPSRADTDGDGIGDRAELGPDLEAVDTDHDGVIDALESATADADGDCLADQVDVANATVDPDGCPIVEPPPATMVDCDAWAHAGILGGGDYLIDPDGDGPGAPFAVKCANTIERGGWTPLTEDYLPYTASAPHEYLFAPSATMWVRTAAAGAWDWTKATGASGVWPWSADGEAGALACDGAASHPGVGVGCTVAPSNLEVYVDATKVDTATGLARVCFAGIGSSPPGCVDDVQVYARRVACSVPNGQVVGDGGFEAFASGACWAAREVDGATVAPDATDRAPGEQGSSLAVDPSGTSAWTANIEQDHLTLVPGHAYSVVAWLKGSGLTKADVYIDGASALAFGDDAHPDDTWRRFERGFVAGALETDARITIALAGTGSARVDAMALLDLGPDRCGALGDALTADAGFENGLACWGLEDAAPPTTWTTVDRAATAHPGGAAPMIAIEHLAGSGTPPNLVQQPLALTAGDWYRMEGWFLGSAASDVLLLVGKPDTGSVAEHPQALVADTWTHVVHDLLVPADAATTEAWFEAHVDAPIGELVSLDDLALRHMGPSPCVATFPELVADGEFIAGPLCWEQTFAAADLGAFSADEAEAPSGGTAPALRFDPTGNGVNSTDVLISQAGLSLPSNTYDITFAVRALTPTSLIVVVRAADGSKTYFNQIVNMTNTWTPKAFTFTVGTADPSAVVEVRLGLTSNTTWLDALSIVGQTF